MRLVHQPDQLVLVAVIFQVVVRLVMAAKVMVVMVNVAHSVAHAFPLMLVVLAWGTVRAAGRSAARGDRRLRGTLAFRRLSSLITFLALVLLV
jgi:hypothetical protein